MEQTGGAYEPCYGHGANQIAQPNHGQLGQVFFCEEKPNFACVEVKIKGVDAVEANGEQNGADVMVVDAQIGAGAKGNHHASQNAFA